MQGSRHREHCHRVEKEVRAFSIEARRRQKKDARRKARHPQLILLKFRFDPLPYARDVAERQGDAPAPEQPRAPDAMIRKLVKGAMLVASPWLVANAEPEAYFPSLPLGFPLDFSSSACDLDGWASEVGSFDRMAQSAFFFGRQNAMLQPPSGRLQWQMSSGKCLRMFRRPMRTQ
jgi:hypothetical protein